MQTLTSPFITNATTFDIDVVCAKYGLDPVQQKAKTDRLYAKYGVDPVLNLSPRISVLTGEEEGCFSVIKKAVENLKNDIFSKIPYEVSEAVAFVASVGTDLIILSNFVIVEIALPILKTITNATIAANDYIEISFLNKLIPKTRILSILSLPASLYELAENIRKFTNSLFDGLIKKMILKASAVFSSLSDMSWSCASFVDGLISIGEIAGPVAELASTCLDTIAIVFSLPVIVLEGRKLSKIKQFEERLNFAEARELSDLADSINKEKNKTLEKFFGVADGGLLKAQLSQIVKNNDEQANKEMIKALKERIVLNKLCYSLRIIVAVISIIACSILLFPTPAAPFAYALIALVSALSLAAFFIDRYASKNLKFTLSKFAPENSEEINKYLDKIKTEQWKAFGRKAARQKVASIINWQPRPRHNYNCILPLKF